MQMRFFCQLTKCASCPAHFPLTRGILPKNLGIARGIATKSAIFARSGNFCAWSGGQNRRASSPAKQEWKTATGLLRRGLADDEPDHEEDQRNRQSAAGNADESKFPDILENVRPGFEHAGDQRVSAEDHDQ